MRVPPVRRTGEVRISSNDPELMKRFANTAMTSRHDRLTPCGDHARSHPARSPRRRSQFGKGAENRVVKRVEIDLGLCHEAGPLDLHRSSRNPDFGSDRARSDDELRSS